MREVNGMIKISAACLCNVGKVRSNNEDNLYFNDLVLSEQNDGMKDAAVYDNLLIRPVFFGVFDGMGGAMNGETASFLAAYSLKQAISAGLKPKELNDYLLKANDIICETGTQRGISMMGSTAVILALTRRKVFLANIGDSKAFLLRNKVLKQISVDHTDASFLSQYSSRKRKPSLTQHLGIEPYEMVIEPFNLTFNLCQGDKYLLCSDGLTDMLSESQIQQIISEEEPTVTSVYKLIDSALDAGGKDNITVVLCSIK